MRIEMETMNPIELIRRTAEEIQYLMDVRRESKKRGALPDIPEEQDEMIQLYWNGLRLIGKAWDLQAEAESALEKLRDTVSAEEDCDPCTWTGEQILDILWGFFDTAVRLDSPEDRQAIRGLAGEIMDFHGLDLRINGSRIKPR